MFKKKLILDNSNELSNKIKDLKDGEAIQIFEKGQETKVVLTMEDYFRLLQIKDSTIKEHKSVPYDPIKLKTEIDQKTKEISNAMNNHDKNKVNGISEF